MQEIINLLESTFEDAHFSQEEKYQFQTSLEQSSAEAEDFNYVRNQAFEMARQSIIKDPQQSLAAIKWLERVVKVIDQVKQPSGFKLIHDALFSPGEECKNRIISLIQGTRKHMEICVFTISDDGIRDAILKAHQSGIQVRIITDDDKTEDRGSDVDYLAERGVPTRMDDAESHMHHKFAIFDGEYLLNGSFNWTRSATKYNNENITVTNQPEMVEQFSHYFEKLWKAFA